MNRNFKSVFKFIIQNKDIRKRVTYKYIVHTNLTNKCYIEIIKVSQNPAIHRTFSYFATFFIVIATKRLNYSI